MVSNLEIPHKNKLTNVKLMLTYRLEVSVMLQGTDAAKTHLCYLILNFQVVDCPLHLPILSNPYS
jgi:hypothetical protein